MPRLTIDQREVDVPPGASILDAARRAGIDIPTLCHLDGCTPATSCMVCVVKVRNPDRLLPACGARAENGMEVESETDEVHAARRAALELLLSDHPGDCIGPCQGICPARMDVPHMVRRAAAGDFAGAAATARAALVLPATLGRICPAPCEKGCRRADHDAAVGIRLLHRRAADSDLAAGRPALPARRPTTGKRVAVIGAGPCGLAAAWRLAQEGAACTVFDDQDRPGGSLRRSVPESQLPRDVLDAEIALVAALGVEFKLSTGVGRDAALADLQRDFDAVLIAAGAHAPPGGAAASPGSLLPDGAQVDRRTYETSVRGLFAAGDFVHAHRMAVRAVADGAAAARSVLRFLAGDAPAAPRRPFTTRLHAPTAEEMARLVAGASPAGRVAPAGGEAAGLSPEEARREAARCLHCDCRKADACKLRRYAEAYGASPGRYHGTRRQFEQESRHPDVVYEPGKCISCGLCIQAAARAGEPLGLAFIGRGFNVRVAVPFSRTLEEGLRKAAAECVAACPTGALAFKRS
ncbi:MAG: 2Fe-2S iron-sulfur cluster binding domain-containing protein [Planctomycetes bacterium]|nr:2Fe-2S iron-sulfur cluster binding domain-containing protein [Planctomycetota bacterium]